MPTLTQFSITHSRLLLCVGLLLTALGLFATGAQAQIKPLQLKGEFFDLKVKRGGTFLELQFSSKHPVLPLVVASRKPLTMKPGFKDFANPKADFASVVLPLLAGVSNTHEVVLQNLKPNTLYYIGIIGHRKDGGQVFLPVINKKEKTLGRKVRAKFNVIKMKNDSDDLSDGDFTFYFFAFNKKMNTKTKPLAAKKYTKGDDWIGSGETKTINVKLKTINYNKDTLWLAVSGMDSDPESTLFGVPFTSFPPGMVYKGNGSDPRHEWASGWRGFDVSGTSVEGGSYSAQEKFTTSFTVLASKGDVSFKAFGTLEVWYE